MLVSRGQTAFFLLYSDGSLSRPNIKEKKRSGHARLGVCVNTYSMKYISSRLTAQGSLNILTDVLLYGAL